MDTDDVLATTEPNQEPRSGCLVTGCPCRDPRIVSHRRAKFFAHLAAAHGETARRIIMAEPDWRLPDPA